MKNTTIEIHGVQSYLEENKPNIILEFPGYLNNVVTGISFYINNQTFSLKIDYKILSKVVLSIPDDTAISFVIDNFYKAKEFRFTKEHIIYKEKVFCEVSNIWSEKNRTMFLDYYPEYLLPKP